MRDHITEDETAGFAEALLNAGAQVGGRDDLLKSTALGWACRWGRMKVARLMLEHGADPVEAGAAAPTVRYQHSHCVRGRHARPILRQGILLLPLSLPGKVVLQQGPRSQNTKHNHNDQTTNPAVSSP